MQMPVVNATMRDAVKVALLSTCPRRVLDCSTARRCLVEPCARHHRST